MSQEIPRLEVQERRRLPSDLILLLVCIAAAGTFSVYRGIDANFDFVNYHFYNPWAFFHDRYSIDVAPAMFQTYFNPTIDFPLYALISYLNDQPNLVTFLIGALHGISIFFLYKIARIVFDPARDGEWTTYLFLVGAAVLIGATGAGVRSLVGNNMGDLTVAIFVLLGLWALLASLDAPPRKVLWLLALAGFGAGFAAALKLVAFVYLFALSLVAFVTYGRRAWLLVGFLLGAALGFWLGGGWFYALSYERFGNPIFPIMNDIFRSPFAEAVDHKYKAVPATALEWVFYPLLWSLSPTRVAQLPFRDPRVALALALGVAALLNLLWGPKSRRSATWERAKNLIDGRAFAIVGAFSFAGYVLWLIKFSTYRYLVVVELLSGVLIIAALASLMPRLSFVRYAAALAVVLCIVATRPLDWGHVPASARYLDVAVPTIPDDSVLLLTGFSPPLTHMVPFFNPRARFVKFDYKFLSPKQDNLLASEGRRLLHDGSRTLFTLRPADQDPAVRQRVFDDSGLVAREVSCEPVSSNIVPVRLVLCRVEREG